MATFSGTLGAPELASDLAHASSSDEGKEAEWHREVDTHAHTHTHIEQVYCCVQ